MKFSNSFNVLFTFFGLLWICSCSAQKDATVSKLEIFNIETGEKTLVKEFPYLIEAPNWTPDGRFLIYNSEGKIYQLEILNPGNDKQIDGGFATNCNNDHVLSSDGKVIAVSHHTAEDGQSRIYTFPIEGGNPTLITPIAPSYLHGWSPDKNWLSYCADRKGNYDVYLIPAKGGIEKRLTDSEGLDDGPEFSPCGSYIWFNSVRTGLMQIWRMKIDGTEQTQMTFDENRNSWFPHISPDGEKVVYIAYKKGDVEPGDHPRDKDVELLLIPAKGGKPKSLLKLFGGQGTINVNSWAPDSKQFAFVSYVKKR